MEALAEQLRAGLGDSLAVSQELNPVATSLEMISPRQLAYVLGQYSVFSRKIVSFLSDALYVMHCYGWTEVAHELRQNIQEELSEDESTLPHYVLLWRGFETALGVDLLHQQVETATQHFVDAIHRLMSCSRPDFVAGAVYALESTAVPELQMTYEWTRRLFSANRAAIPETISHFFMSHLDEIEVLHESRLRDACSERVTDETSRSGFVAGFHSVVAEMESWWTSLYAEALDVDQEGLQ